MFKYKPFIRYDFIIIYVKKEILLHKLKERSLTSYVSTRARKFFGNANAYDVNAANSL